MSNNKLCILIATNRKNSLTEKMVYFCKKEILKNIYPNVDVIDLKDLPRDFTFSALYENNGKNPKFNILKKKIEDHQKIIIITPEYNGSFPGVLKAFIDGLEYPKTLKGKKVFLIGVSAGKKGCLLGMSHLSDILEHLGVFIYPTKIHIPNILDTNIDLIKQDKDLIKELEKHLRLFLEF